MRIISNLLCIVVGVGCLISLIQAVQHSDTSAMLGWGTALVWEANYLMVRRD